MKISLKNVGIINSCDLEFVTGVNLIVGSSGSGKSTLMRCIYNFVSNGFSDSDISFGKDAMQVVIENDGDVLEYYRSLKTNGVKCYYKVNNEQYVKVGRTSLPQIKDAFKIGDIIINNEPINFNFNLQFAAPFLILGSQSTLYNVLTYRSAFDITSINDYYTEDLKSNKKEVDTNIKVKEHLLEQLGELKKQEAVLRPAEEIYSQYIRYKHKKEFRSEIERLRDNMAELSSQEGRNDKLGSLYLRTKSCVEKSTHLLSITSLREKINNLNKLDTLIDSYTDISDGHERTASKAMCLNDVNTTKSLMNEYNREFRKSKLVSSIKTLYESATSKEVVLQEITKLMSGMVSKNAYVNKINLLSSSDYGKLDTLKAYLDARYLMAAVEEVDKNITAVVSKERVIVEGLSRFRICPLCGGEISMCSDSDKKLIFFIDR